MAGLRGLISTFVARIDERVNRDADPDALIGRSGSRRNGLPVVLRQRDEQSDKQSDEQSDDQPDDARDEVRAQEALDRIRADQHRRMRRGSIGRRSDRQGG